LDTQVQTYIPLTTSTNGWICHEWSERRCLYTRRIEIFITGGGDINITSITTSSLASVALVNGVNNVFILYGIVDFPIQTELNAATIIIKAWFSDIISCKKIL
jgi:hypothetical protein